MIAAAESPETKSESGGSPRPRYDWADPSVPVGDAPPMPRWRLYAAAALWMGFLLFLLAMAILTRRSG